MAVYYNEIDPAAAHVLECLIRDGVIADGIVDRRSIVDVAPGDLSDFTQCHFFAGGGFWSVAARLAGWSDDRPMWTGSCPCQPFSVAGKGLGTNDPRHLWPHFYRLIASCRPPVVLGEQVSGKAGEAWFDGVAADLEGAGYACEAFDIPALAVNAPHIRQRLYWCAVANSGNDGTGGVTGSLADGRRGALDAGADSLRRGDGARLPSWIDARGSGDMADADRCGRSGRAQEPQRGEERRDAAERTCGDMEHAESIGRGEGRPEHEIWRGRSAVAGAGCSDVADADEQGRQGWAVYAERSDECAAGPDGLERGYWDDYEWRTAADGKARRVKPGVRLLVNAWECVGRVAQLRILGNAIVAPLAAEFIAAVMETIDAG